MPNSRSKNSSAKSPRVEKLGGFLLHGHISHLRNESRLGSNPQISRFVQREVNRAYGEHPENEPLGDLGREDPRIGWHSLSNATCLIRPHLLYALLTVSRITIICLQSISQSLKKTCGRQVVLDKWFPLIDERSFGCARTCAGASAGTRLPGRDHGLEGGRHGRRRGHLEREV